jgi:hypothetical protein
MLMLPNLGTTISLGRIDANENSTLQVPSAYVNGGREVVSSQAQKNELT